MNLILKVKLRFSSSFAWKFTHVLVRLGKWQNKVIRKYCCRFSPVIIKAECDILVI